MNKKVFISVGTTFLIVLIVAVLLFIWNSSSDNKSKKKVFANNMVTTTKSGKTKFTKNFSDFSDSIGKFEGKISTTSFSGNSTSMQVSSTIKQVVQQGPTFAGKYAVVTYVCGHECQRSTIVNINTGKIIADGLRSVYNVAYQLDSRLFIVNPVTNLPTDKSKIKQGVATSYYVIEDGKLKFIGKQDLNPKEQEACAQVVTRAKNKATGEDVFFPTPCDVPKFSWKTTR